VFKKNSFLVISITIHLIVVYLAAQSIVFPSVPDSPQKQPNIIQATLIFELPPLVPVVSAEKTDEAPPQVVEPKEVPPDTETPAETQIEPNAEPEVQTVLISPIPQLLPSKSKEDVSEEPEKNNDNDEITISEQTIKPTPSSDARSTATSMARRHLSNFQQQQQNRVAEQASNYYQQHKNSPIIDGEIKNPFMTEDEKLMRDNQVRIDCSSIINKVLTGAAGLMGGQKLRCSKGPPINGFIQDRINKGSLLPKQSRQEAQKRPQSVVIKQQP
jgi:hypothetical protein